VKKEFLLSVSVSVWGCAISQLPFSPLVVKLWVKPLMVSVSCGAHFFDIDRVICQSLIVETGGTLIYHPQT
jgi:hypothetical protein